MIDRYREIHFAELELEGGEEAGMAIPPRANTEKPASRGRIEEQEKPLDLALSSLATTKEKRFVEQARQWEGHVEAPAPFVPFMCYWPEYKDMSEGQTRWYFYWRNEVREGRYPPTGLSYLFLLIYELINGIGWKEPVQGYRLMKEIWIAYREAFPKLDAYLPDWLVDFGLVHRLDVSVRDVAAIAPCSVSGDALEWELMDRFRSEPADLPLEAAALLSDYDVMRSKFCANGGQAMMNAYFPKVFAAVDGYISKKYGARLIERLHPGEPARRERYLFRSAVYDSTLYGSSAAIECVPISSHGPLRAFVTQLMRLTENTLRGLCGYKGRLRGIAVEAEIAALVHRYLEREVGQASAAERERDEPAVRINADKLARLQAESDEVRDMLAVTEEVGEPEGVSRIAGGTRDEPSETRRSGQRGEPEGGRSADVPDILCAEPDEVQMLLSRLTNEQLQLLTSLLASGGELDRQALAKQAPAIMIDLAMDEMNEAALETLGNLVLEEEAGMIGIAEDYREELAVLCACERPGAAELASGESAEGESDKPGMRAIGLAGNHGGMDDEWIQFDRLLEPVHRLTLQAMMAGGEHHSLVKLAEAHGTMAELLFDEINAASMDTIGDLIIDGNEIADDYLPMIEKLAR